MKTRKLLIKDIDEIMHPKHPEPIINLDEKVIDEVLAKLDKMDKEILSKNTQASQLHSEVRVLEHEKYDYLEDIFYGHNDWYPMAGGLLMENHESSEDRRQRNEEARIAREERIDTLIRILQLNKDRIEEKKR